jgi:hypothetical protein
MFRTLFEYIPSLEHIVSFGSKRVGSYVLSEEESRSYRL